MQSDLQQIRIALVGDEALGHRGLVSRLAKLEYTVIIIVAVLMTAGGERLVKLFIK